MRLQNVVWFALFACFVAGFGWMALTASRHLPRNHPSTQETRNTSNNKNEAEHIKEISIPSAFIYFFTPNGLQKIADYCGSDAKGEPDKWLHDKFICEVRATDIVTAVASVLLLVVVTAGLIWIAVSQIRTAQRQLRAYVFAEINENDKPVFQPNSEVRIPMRARNRGQTPAYRVSQWVDMKILPYPLVKEPIADRAPEPPGYIDLGPTAEFLIIGQIPRALTADELAALKKGTKKLYVFGEIRYRDAFAWRRGKRQPRYTRFRFMVHHGPQGEPLGLLACTDGNKAN